MQVSIIYSLEVKVISELFQDEQPAIVTGPNLKASEVCTELLLLE